MVIIGGPTREEQQELQERGRILEFYRENFEDINKLFLENKSLDISALKTYLSDDELFLRLEEACVGAIYQEEQVLFIQEGRFYIYGDEFTEDEISRIVSAYIEDDDIKGYMDLVDSFSSVGEEDEASNISFGMALANFPGNIISKIVEKIRNTPLCRSIRDEVDKINGM